MSPKMDRRIEAIEALALSKGLDPFPVCYEEVPREIIWNIASYGLPTRMSHWSFGKSFLHTKLNGEMGYSKIYELILNNNPSYAFLDDTNTDVVNLLIVAHCIGHSDFFKKNICFSKTNRSMINQAEQNAAIIEDYKSKYGVEVVEDWMDIGFALDRHIDYNLGETRPKYPEPELVYKTNHPLPYADIHGDSNKPSITEKMINDKLPPHPEKDLLWFLINYSDKMLPWQREVLSIIRSESFYFYPQMITKIMNEGWASFWHAELMMEYKDLTADEHLEFSRSHSGVVNPGRPGNINPYYVGFKIFNDIRARWDAAYERGKNNAEFQSGTQLEQFDDDGKIIYSKLTGMEKMFRVREDDDDTSFIFTYLTYDLAKEMQMFTYGLAGADPTPSKDDTILKSRELHKIREGLTQRLANYGAPQIAVESVKDGVLNLVHAKSDGSPLDPAYTKATLAYIHKVWRKKVTLKTYDRFGQEQIYKHDDSGASTESADKYGKEIDLKM